MGRARLERADGSVPGRLRLSARGGKGCQRLRARQRVASVVELDETTAFDTASDPAGRPIERDGAVHGRLAAGAAGGCVEEGLDPPVFCRDDDAPRVGLDRYRRAVGTPKATDAAAVGWPCGQSTRGLFVGTGCGEAGRGPKETSGQELPAPCSVLQEMEIEAGDLRRVEGRVGMGPVPSLQAGPLSRCQGPTRHHGLATEASDRLGGNDWARQRCEDPEKGGPDEGPEASCGART